MSFVVTAKLICVFVFAYAKSPFSHDASLMMSHDLMCWNVNNIRMVNYRDFQ